MAYANSRGGQRGRSQGRPGSQGRSGGSGRPGAQGRSGSPNRFQGRAAGKAGRSDNNRGGRGSQDQWRAGRGYQGKPGGKGASRPGARGQAARQGQRSGGYRGQHGYKPGARGAQAAESCYIEGRRACFEALEAGVPLRRALTTKGEANPTLENLLQRLNDAGVPIEQVARTKLDALSSHGAHQGIVVQTEPFPYATLDDVIQRAGGGPALVIVLDHVTDEGNFGAIVRSAEVVGAAGVVIAKARSASVGTAAYKTSAGAVMHLPVAQVANLGAAIDELKKVGFWAGAATEHAHDDVWHAPMGGRLCLVMGSEGSGISRLVRQKCDFECRLPQRGRVESLNVAQATTVLCYEWLRRVSESDATLASQNDAGVAGAAAPDAASLDYAARANYAADMPSDLEEYDASEPGASEPEGLDYDYVPESNLFDNLPARPAHEPFEPDLEVWDDAPATNEGAPE